MRSPKADCEHPGCLLCTGRPLGDTRLGNSDSEQAWMECYSTLIIAILIQISDSESQHPRWL